jgi:hypothetical protein
LARFSFARSGLGYLAICPTAAYAMARLDMDILPPLRGWTAEGGGSHGDAYMETQKNPASRKGRQIWDPDSLQRFDRIYFRRALRGQVAGKQCNTEKHQWCENKGRQIMRADSVEHARHEPGQQ